MLESMKKNEEKVFEWIKVKLYQINENNKPLNLRNVMNSKYKEQNPTLLLHNQVDQNSDKKCILKAAGVYFVQRTINNAEKRFPIRKRRSWCHIFKALPEKSLN